MAPSPSSSASTSVQVAVRIRPTTTQDTNNIPARFQRPVIHAQSSTSVSVDTNVNAGTSNGPVAPSPASSSAAAKKQVFSFDQVHGQSTTQHHLFTSTAEPLTTRFLEGFNCTILAYGQTSSGKTFTMTGIDLDADPSDPNNGMGIVPRAVSTIFGRAQQLKDERAGTWNYSVKGSFIEIYNEDLIDLLSMDDSTGGRREVQIREDKDGHIIWGGLREVGVKNANEVMSLIRKGTSIRRTNETDMNAQSSRSHAIFSLTLTQKKFTGSGAPPRSSSPLPPNGRSPSRLARPGSVYATSSASGTRVGSPTFGRPSTPSFAAAMGRGGLRPASSLGHSADRSLSVSAGGDEEGEWVTIVSKFHFVDLAGSERLKRTAAAGERVKEGISINSGLLALGNVISALGDPARAKAATHIPYRDSKLTRLLQDSLGGNSHTLMIACVSPAEYNAGETINTLKYANRARNIKNRATINEKENGWDDLEWLQGTVTRLRKELKVIKDGGAVVTLTESTSSDGVEGAGKKVLAQMGELRTNYEDLRAKFVDRTEELTRLRSELGESHRASTGIIGGGSKYEEIVGPVIEEYEKTIATMEAELSLNRAALRHTNELVEEKEEELLGINERHAATELYVEELRSRVAKLTEREASTEAYVRDLEEKMKNYDENSVTSSVSLTDLKREISKFKDTENYSSKYITDLEARLARSDESILSLQQTVEKLEKECERRREEAETLQSRLEILREDSESWRSDLEARELKLKDLESQMQIWEKKRLEAGETRSRLGEVVNEVASARKVLEAETEGSGDDKSAISTPIDTTGKPLPLNGDSHSPTDGDKGLSSQLLDLQQTHTATLADLSSVTSKYRDALREISDLAAQIQELKLSQESADSPPLDSLPETPSLRRRMPSGKIRDLDQPQHNNAGRRLFFRQAASTESLHLRSLSQSQSLSQELSSVHSRKTSFSSHGTSSLTGSPLLSSHALNGSRPNLSISLPNGTPLSPGERSAALLDRSPGERSVTSLEKEIMRLQEVLKEREAEISLLENQLKDAPLTATLATPQTPVAKVTGLPSENGINGHSDSPPLPASLSPKTIGRFNHIRKSMELSNYHLHSDSIDGGDGSEADGSAVSEADESLERLNELMLSMAQKESSHREIVDDLNSQLSAVRRQLDDLTALSRDQAINMSTEIGALQTKHEADLERLEAAQEREVELVAALEKAHVDHLAALESLRNEHKDNAAVTSQDTEALLLQLKEENNTSLLSMRGEIATAQAALIKATEDHDTALGRQNVAHAEELKARAAEVEAMLAKVTLDHNAAIALLTSTNADNLKARIQEVEETLATTKEEHETALAKLSSTHQQALKAQDAESRQTLHQTEEDYYNALTKLRADQAEELATAAAEHASALLKVQEEHASELRVAEMANQGSLSNSISIQNAMLQDLRTEHAAAISRKETSHTEGLEALRNEHARALATKEQDHVVSQEKLRAEHDNILAKLKEEWRLEVEHLNSSLSDLRTSSVAAAKKAESNKETAIQELNRQHTETVQALEREREQVEEAMKASHVSALEGLRRELEATHADMIAAQQVELLNAHTAALDGLRDELTASHSATTLALQAEHSASRDAALLDTTAESSKTLATTQQAHQDAITKLTSEHEDAVTKLNESLEALRVHHASALEDLQQHAARVLAQEKERTSKLLEELENKHVSALESLRGENDLAVQELEAHKSAAEEFTLLREQTRQSHAEMLDQKDEVIREMDQRLSTAETERETLVSEVAQLKAELAQTRATQSQLVQEASNRESVVFELERHRSVLADLQENLQKVKDEKDTLQMEKNRSESMVRDLQAQLARSTSPPPGSVMRSPAERAVSSYRGQTMGMKLPPPTPPPSGPPPPPPLRSITQHPSTDMSTSSHASSTLGSSSSRESAPESPVTSVGHTPTLPSAATPVPDSNIAVTLQQQAKHIDEQDAMIKTLNKQLTHCESDLQTHMDLVSTLEGQLGDSEKNLRKARMQATEIARERDGLSAKLEPLRNELNEAKREVANARKSIVEEKQSYEQKLEEERKARDRARAQLDSRMEELTLKRKSKFACL